MRGRLGSELVEISAFAELTGLSVDALRHYHDLGVLVPAEVVPTSRYRRYHLDQVGRARQIAFLRSVDMPLPRIRELLDASTDRDALRLLLEHRSALTERARRAADLVDRLDDYVRRGPLTTSTPRDDLRRELISMFDEHQAVALALFEETRSLRPDRFLFELPADQRPASYDQAAALSQRHAARLDEIIGECGGSWPGTNVAGDDGEAAAWGIAQHADDDNDRCKRWLPLLEAAVAEGNAPPLHLALLTDRVLLRDHAPQRYGTIVEPAGDTWRPRPPIEDEENLDRRRRRLGIEDVATWLGGLPSPDAWYAT